jgi:hypothetical protein
MSFLGPWRTAVGGALAVLVVGVAGPAYADDGLQQCLDRAIDHDGVPPTCTEVNGTWHASWPGDGGDGIPGAFVFLLVVGLVITICVTVWKVSTARRLASESGMDPGLATQLTLLSDDGLDATYLAASLRRPAPTAGPEPAPAAPASTPAAERLAELKGLLDAGLVTQTEYDERRQAIIDAV